MKIETIEVRLLKIPFSRPFRTAFMNIKENAALFVSLGSGGLYGYGESNCFFAPCFSSSYGASDFYIAKEFIAPTLIGQTINSGEELNERLSWIKGNQFAKAPFDLAWWDLNARFHEKPLHRFLGGKAGTVVVGADFGIADHLGVLLKNIQGAVDAGYARIKIKIAKGWDVEVMRAVRKRFPDAVMHVDANCAYTLNDLELMKKLDQLDLAMIEQPLAHDDLLDHAELQRHLKTPICLDESITSLDKARKAVQIGACEYINIKLGRVGGLTEAKRIHDYCAEKGTPCWVGGMLETAIGQAHSRAFASLPNMKYPSDIFPTDRFYHEDLTSSLFIQDGPSYFDLPEEAGIGLSPEDRKLQRYTAQVAKF